MCEVMRYMYAVEQVQETFINVFIKALLDPKDVCGRAEETTAHMLQCSQPAHPCSLDDLITFNDVGKIMRGTMDKDVLKTRY